MSEEQIKRKTYDVYQQMKQRCLNPKCKAYKWYGARGISVSDSWRKSFLNFVADMGMKPEGYSLERVDNNLGYSKENCRWITMWEQARNRRSNHVIEYQGRSQIVQDWSDELGISTQVFKWRLKHWGLDGVMNNKNYKKEAKKHA